jgi:hypothetical protein
MSSLDPFGGPPSRPIAAYGSYKPRGKTGDASVLWKNLEGTARDFGSTVGQQLSGQGRGWNGFSGILNLVDLLFGGVFLLFSVKMGDVVLLATAIAVGATSAVSRAALPSSSCNAPPQYSIVCHIVLLACFCGSKAENTVRQCSNPDQVSRGG